MFPSTTEAFVTDRIGGASSLTIVADPLRVPDGAPELFERSSVKVSSRSKVPSPFTVIDNGLRDVHGGERHGSALGRRSRYRPWRFRASCVQSDRDGQARRVRQDHVEADRARSALSLDDRRLVDVDHGKELVVSRSCRGLAVPQRCVRGAVREDAEGLVELGDDVPVDGHPERLARVPGDEGQKCPTRRCSRPAGSPSSSAVAQSTVTV